MDPFLGFEMNRLDDDEDDAMAAGPSYRRDFRAITSTSGGSCTKASSSIGHNITKADTSSRDSIITVVEREPQVKEKATSENKTTVLEFIKAEDRKKNLPKYRVRWILINIVIFVAVIILCCIVGIINERYLSWISVRCAFVTVETFAIIGVVLSTKRFCRKRKEVAESLEQGVKLTNAQMFSKALGEKIREDRLKGRGLPTWFPPRENEHDTISN